MTTNNGKLTHVVVTRGRMRKSKRWIVHTYGPYSQTVAKSIKSQILRDKEEGDELTVSVCRLLNPGRDRIQ